MSLQAHNRAVRSDTPTRVHRTAIGPSQERWQTPLEEHTDDA